PFYPGPMQLRYQVPTNERELWMPFRLRPRGFSDPVTARVLVKRGDAPITFEYDLVSVDDPGDPTGETGRVREVVLVSGDWDLEIEPEHLAADEYVARVTGLEPGGVVHVARGDGWMAPATASDVWIGTPGAVGPEPDDGSGASSGDDPSGAVHAQDAVSSGCGCRSSAPSQPFGVMLTMLLLG